MHFVLSAGFPLSSDNLPHVLHTDEYQLCHMFPGKQHIMLLLIVTFLKIKYKLCVSHHKRKEKALRLESSVCCKGERYSSSVSSSCPCCFTFISIYEHGCPEELSGDMLSFNQSFDWDRWVLKLSCSTWLTPTILICDYISMVEVPAQAG